MFSLGDFASSLLTAGPLIERGVHEMVQQQCEAIQEEAKALIGTYDAGWPQLAPSTQEDRVRKGFAANEPLLRTGDLRDSIQYAVEGNVGYVFSNSPYAKYHEFGSSRVPARPFLASAAMRMESKIVDIAGQGTAALLWSALLKSPLRTLRAAVHIGEILPGAGDVTHVVR